MSLIREWFRLAASNGAASPDGWPEGMTREEVNDSARENMASTKIFYDDPTYRRPLEDYGITRVTGTDFILVDGSVETDPTKLLSLKQRVRMRDLGSTWVGEIATIGAYGAPNTSIVITWDAALSPDAIGPTTVPDYMDVGPRSMGTSIWLDTGTGAGELPTIGDLDAHVLKAEATLDVGFLDGQTREQLMQAATRGRLNMNGAFDVWQRGTTFDGSTVPGNNDGNVTADGWAIISDGNDVVDITRDVDAPAGALYSMRLESQSTVKYGVILPIEQKDALDVGMAGIGATGKISASFKAKFDSAATGIDTIRAYLLNIKTAVPGDPVTSWPAGAGSDFTVASGDWTIIASVSVTLTGSWQTFTPSEFENVDPDLVASGNGGLAIAFHVDEATIAAGSAWFLGDAQINAGEETLPFIRMPASWEMERAYRYCETTFNSEGPLGHNKGNANALQTVCVTDTGALTWLFNQPKYKTPTLVTYNPGVASPTNNWYDGSEEIAVVSSVNDKSAQLSFTTATNDATIYRLGAMVHANVYGTS